MRCQEQAKQQESSEALNQIRKPDHLESTGSKEEEQRLKANARNRAYYRRWGVRKTPDQIRQEHKRYHERYPWIRHYYLAKSRCENRNNISFKNYGGKGVKFNMTIGDFKFLWDRDQAKAMIRPSIDRIRSCDNYDLSNCRFLELSKNAGRTHKEKTHCKRGHPFNKENTYIQKKGRCCKKCQYLKTKEWRERKNESKNREN